MAWRILLVCGLALALLAPPAAAQSTRIKILRECAQEGRLTGDYTAQQIRDARSNIPDDIDEYTDCRDVLTRALLSRAGGDGGSGGAGGGTAGGGTGGGTGTGGGGSGGEMLTPSTDADREALDTAGKATQTPVEVSGARVTPGSAGELRNDLPTTLIVLLALLGAAALAATAPYARRHAATPLRALGPAIRRVLPGRTA
ncbi:MAG TPA: hypothetical protein VFP78_22495 [Solirubrobacteraceae bacterium]|nr:hypothetical protein [Solirubrobacteraceae bacterium]